MVYHSDNFRIDRFRKHSLVTGHVVKDFIQSSSFDFLRSQIIHWIGKVKNVTALLNLADKKLSSLFGRGICMCVWEGGGGCVMCVYIKGRGRVLCVHVTRRGCRCTMNVCVCEGVVV